MKNIYLSLALLLSTVSSAFSQVEQSGPFIGGNGFIYKSNLYNAHDAATDSVQKYSITMGFSGGFDFGYKSLNGISISSGISFGTSNQNYKSNDTIFGDILKFTANSKMTFVKIPLILSMQTRNDKPLKAFYSLGLFYSYNSGYSETINWDYTYNNFSPDLTTTIKKQSIENKYDKDTNKYVSNLSERPYRRHGWGAIMAMGASKRFNKNSEWFLQAKIEYQISSSENNDEIIFTPAAGSKDTKRVGHVWGNYAKYMHKKEGNYNRPATHPFNLGITFGIRYFLWDFE